MSIHAISGKPGGGKSLYAVRLLTDELRYGSRVVVTNLPLNLGALNEYMQKVCPDKAVDLLHRVRVLTDDQTQEFWTYRPGRRGSYEWVRVPRCSKDDWEAGVKPDYSVVVDEGVWYCIDECHNFFNARAWALTGRDVLFYLSQHRKLGDTVVWVTQSIGNVDKQFRSVTQDYTYLRNLNKEKMGFFKLPGIFVRKTFLEPAGPTSEPMEKGTFKLDVSGLGSCYNTAAGVGIHNRVTADQHERRKGLPWWSFLIIVAALTLAFVLGVPKAITAFVTRGLYPRLHHGNVSDVQTPVPSVKLDSGDPVSVDTQGPVRQTPAKLSFGPDVGNARNFRESVSMVGYSSVAKFHDGIPQPVKRVEVHLSDGTTWRSGDGHLQYLCEDYCIVDGRTNWYHPVVVSNAPTVADLRAGTSLAPQPVVLPQSEYGSGSSVIVIGGAC